MGHMSLYFNIRRTQSHLVSRCHTSPDSPTLSYRYLQSTAGGIAASHLGQFARPVPSEGKECLGDTVANQMIQEASDDSDTTTLMENNMRASQPVQRGMLDYTERALRRHAIKSGLLHCSTRSVSDDSDSEPPHHPRFDHISELASHGTY